MDYKIPLAISAVDTFEARFEIQDALPKRILNAGIDGTITEVSVHGFAGDGPCLACIGLNEQRESWNAKAIAEATGLPPERVRTLILNNAELTPEDVSLIKSAAKAHPDILAGVEDFIGQPLLSFWNRVAYGETNVQTSAGSSVKITTAFVSGYAGLLLFAELLKELTPELRKYIVNNSYRQDLLGVPAQDVFKHARDKQGYCLCHSAFRQNIYKEKYG
jgi:hypothetical protein